MKLTMSRRAFNPAACRPGLRALAFAILACPLWLGSAGGALAASPIRTHALASQVMMADDYYLGRAKLSNAEETLKLLRQAVASNPKDYEAWWRMARLQSFLGREREGRDDKSAIQAFQAGVDAGRRAVALQPDRVEGHFWLGANVGLLAEDEGWIKGLELADTVRKEMETVIRLDPDYERAAGQRVLARLDYRAPFFKGGDKERSIQLLEDVLKRFPRDSFALLYLADDDLALGRKDEARALLEQILGLCPDPLYGPELAANQAEARDRLQHEFHSGK